MFISVPAIVSIYVLGMCVTINLWLDDHSGDRSMLLKLLSVVFWPVYMLGILIWAIILSIKDK